MPIIYTYPSLSPANTSDTVIVSDSQDTSTPKATKTVTIADILSLGSGTATFYDGLGGIDITGTDISLDITPNAGLVLTGAAPNETVGVDIKADSGIVFDGGEISMNLGASSITGTLAVADGGTGRTTLTSGEFLKGNGTGAIALAATIDLDSEVHDVLPVANGGTGANTLTDGGVLLGNGTGIVGAMAVLASGEIIIGDGVTDPTTYACFGGAGPAYILKATAGGTGWGTYTTGDMLYADGVSSLNKLGIGTKGSRLTSTGSVISWVAPGGGPWLNLSTGATVTWDYQDGSNAILSLTANADVLSIINVQDGDNGWLIVDGTTNQTMSLPDNGGTILSKLAGTTSYTPTAGIDVFQWTVRVAGGNTVFWWVKSANMLTYVP